MRNLNRGGALALSLAISQILVAQGATAQGAIEEVVVTAQKREQSLQEVPIAISAFSADQIEQRGITSIEGMTAIAPNVQISKAPGSATASQIAIRGSVQQNPALYWEQPTGVYVDGVYIGKSLGSIFDVIDVERIEVLRGPQGTLYGRNTLAGALSIVSRKPSGEFSGTAMVSLGKYDEHTTKAMVDLPRMGIASISFGLQSLQRDGWVKVHGPGPAREAGNRDSVSGRLAVNLAFTEDFEADYRYDYTDIDQEPPFSQVYRNNIRDVYGPGLAAGMATPSKRRLKHANLDLDTYEKSRIDGHSLTLSWNLNEHHTLKSISAYRKMDWDDAIDLDGGPTAMAHTSRESEYDQKSQELQLLGNGDRWNYVAGLYYFADDGDMLNPQTFFLGGANYDSRYDFETRSRAVFGQFDYQITDALTLTAGLRYTKEKKKASRSLILDGVFYDPGTDAWYPYTDVWIPVGTRGSKTFNSTTPLVSLSYELPNSDMVYVKYSEGFKSGGFNGEFSGASGQVEANVREASTAFKPEEMKSWEAGYKGMFWDGRAQVNAAAFFNKIQDMQLSIFTAAGASGSVVRNAGEAEVKGFELEGVLVPTDWLRLQLSYGYLHTEYKKYMDAGIDQSSNRAVIHAPKHTVNLLLDARLAEADYGTWRFIADYSYKTSWYSYPYQLAYSGPRHDPSQPVAGDSWVPATRLLNLRLALTEIPLGNGHGEAALWVRNATDEDRVLNFIDFGPAFGNLTTSYWQDPRMYGASFTYRW